MQDGAPNLSSPWRGQGGLLLAVALFSGAVNLLMLTGPLFMLQIYERVLPARAEESLTVLFLLVVFLFTTMAVLDAVRARLMTRIGARILTRLEGPAFDAMLRRGPPAREGQPEPAGLHDLGIVQQLIGAPVLLAIFDLPFIPIFLGALFLFHPLLGGFALLGAAILIAATALRQWLIAGPLAQSSLARMDADRIARQFLARSDLIAAFGMHLAGTLRWRQTRLRALLPALAVQDLVAGFTAFSRSFRLFLQSAMLALGAWLVLRDALTPGVMFAASILLARMLAPVEQLLAGWPLLIEASASWKRLGHLPGHLSDTGTCVVSPHPAGALDVRQLSVIPPGRQMPALRMVSFTVNPGEALGVIGPTGAGKSTLAKALCGAWPGRAGAIRLGGVALDRHDPDERSSLFGYLPQMVELFDGTIAENIACCCPQQDDSAVITAASRAGAHRFILDLPDGYDTRLGRGGYGLSGGQLQRIGLARALYGNPAVLVLDEPNACLDHEGSAALHAAIRAQKAADGMVVLLTNRPNAIAECDRLMVLENGRRGIFGPRDEVLRATVVDAIVFKRAAQAGGSA